MTANPAAATKAMSSRSRVATVRARASPARDLPGSDSKAATCVEERNAAKAAGVDFSSTVADCTGPAPAGEISANWSLRSRGFSTRPTTFRSWPPSVSDPPMPTPKVLARPSVRATSPAPAG